MQVREVTGVMNFPSLFAKRLLMNSQFLLTENVIGQNISVS
jgi:hypothetical protein